MDAHPQARSGLTGARPKVSRVPVGSDVSSSPAPTRRRQTRDAAVVRRCSLLTVAAISGAIEVGDRSMSTRSRDAPTRALARAPARLGRDRFGYARSAPREAQGGYGRVITPDKRRPIAAGRPARLTKPVSGVSTSIPSLARRAPSSEEELDSPNQEHRSYSTMARRCDRRYKSCGCGSGWMPRLSLMQLAV